MKLHKKLLLVVINALLLIACSNEPPELTIYDNDLTTDENKIAMIEGESTPNSIIHLSYDKVGFGSSNDIVEMQTTANEDGYFNFEVDWQTTYYLRSELKGKTSEEKEVKVVHRKEEKLKPKSEPSSKSKLTKKPSTKREKVNKEEKVPREFENALQSANDYLNYTSFSKESLYDQLIYEGYPEEATQYAVDNVITDWNENALQAAKDYLDYSSFSDQGLYDQLIYEGYTTDQAQYAIDNLDE